MTGPVTCPYCSEPHTLSQCPKWRIAGCPAVAGDGPVQAVESALMVGGGVAPAQRSGGGLRATMPLSAQIVDELRLVFGQEAVDKLLRAARNGEPRAYFAEAGADGHVREWGRAPSGRRGVLVGGQVVMGGAACSR